MRRCAATLLVASALAGSACTQRGDSGEESAAQDPLVAVDASEARSYRTGTSEGRFSISGRCLVLSVPEQGQFTPVFFVRPHLAQPGAPTRPSQDLNSGGAAPIPLETLVTLAGAPVPEGARGPEIAADVRKGCSQRYFIVAYIEDSAGGVADRRRSPPLPERR